MLGRSARARAARLLDEIVEAFRPLGYREAGRPGPLSARLERRGSPALELGFIQRGRVVGGQIVLEVTTAEPVLPRSDRGLSARARGTVKLRGVTFKARGGDASGQQLAERLSADQRLGEALAKVHFDRIRVDPDGRPVIAHVGGSVVWTLFPPLIRPVPLVPEQAKATAKAMEAFAGAGRGR